MYVGRYSASSFCSGSRPSRLGVSMIKRNGLFLMQPIMTACSMRYAFFPSSSGGRSLSKYGVVLLATSSATFRSVGQQLRGTRRAGIATRRKSIPVFHRSTTVFPSVEDPEPTLSSFRYECESYHCSAKMRHRHQDHFVRLRNDLQRITSLMNHQVHHVMFDYACNAQDD